jgi:hypothetical protein
MKRFHLIFGLILLVVFLLTGQYMDRFHEHLQYMPDGPRIIMLAVGALLHVVSGVKDGSTAAS